MSASDGNKSSHSIDVTIDSPVRFRIARYMELTAKMARLEAQIAELKMQQARKEAEEATNIEEAWKADESKLEKTAISRSKKTAPARPTNPASNSAEGKMEGKRKAKAKEGGGARKKRKTASVSGVAIDSEVFSSGSEDEKHERMEQAVDKDMMVDSDACDLCRSSGVALGCVWPDENTKVTSCRRCIDQKKPCKVSGRPVSQQKAALHQLSKDMDDKAFGLFMVEMMKSVRDSTDAMKGLLSSVEKVLEDMPGWRRDWRAEFMGKN
ncbi:hypothetical protein BC629DRAFT_1017054 [Irpex lacteus]|nr:hypothetical protein BC629DRAFT_1017054 [Irpex lacteus]